MHTSAFETSDNLAFRAAKRWTVVGLVVGLIAVITAALVPPSTFAFILITLTASASTAIVGYQVGSQITESAFWGVLAKNGYSSSKPTTKSTNGQKTS